MRVCIKCVSMEYRIILLIVSILFSGIVLAQGTPNTDTVNTRVSFRQDFAIKAHGALITDSVYDAEALSLIDGLSVAAVVPEPRRSLCMALKTNMLYDALLVPCIGAEFSLGRGWSVAANWIYAWWKNNSRHNYWRVYGGDLGVRKYIGSKERQLLLTGHHLGLYGQILTYDLALGGRGYMAGKPGGNLFDKANYAVGAEYGYSLPVGRRINIDFAIGIGYMGGTYHEYLPIDGCYVWQCTKQRRWFGPTKAEVSLVWRIGRGTDFRKGGKR